MHIRKFLALLLLLTLLLAACGGDDDNNDNDNDSGGRAEAVDDTDTGNSASADDASSGGADDDHSASTAPDLPEVSLGDDARTYVWEDFGVTIQMPADWGAIAGGRDFDLSLASPAALAGDEGPFLTFKVYTSLGTDSLEEAMQPIADDTGADLVSFGSDALGVTVNDEAGVQSLVLYPYRDKGAALFVQASGMTVEEAALNKAILESITIAPPAVDVDAANAAFQASLEADGTLTYGDPDAPIVMREYLSFTCGHCATYTLPVENLIALDVETGRVRLEIAPLASDPKTTLATHALYCATEQGLGFSAYKALFQDYLSHGYEVAYTADSVNTILTDLGLDMDAINACINDAKYTPVLDQVRIGFVDLGLTGTPTMVVATGDDAPAPLLFPDGQVWSGVIPLAALRSIIDLIVEQDLAPQEAANVLFSG